MSDQPEHFDHEIEQAARLTALVLGELNGQVEVELVEGHGVDDVLITLPETGAIQGSIRDAAGVALSGIRIRAQGDVFIKGQRIQ